MSERALIFEVKGKFAHWRKFYTNSSSLTYYFPTRTNVIGLIASILELERDSYYDLLSRDNLSVGLKMNSDVKKNIFVMNYRSTKDRMSSMIEGYTQIKLEVLMPKSFSENISYRIYLRPNNKATEELLARLEEKLRNDHLGYGIYLGQRAFQGYTKIISGLKETKVKFIAKSDYVESVIKKEDVKGNLDFEDQRTMYIKDRIPLDFNSEREVTATEEVLYELNNHKITLSDGHLTNCYKVGGEVISFL